MAELPPPAGSPAGADLGTTTNEAPAAAAAAADAGAPPPPADPGNWNMLHQEADSVLSIGKTFWEGAKVIYNRGLSNTFQCAHTFTLTPEGDKANSYSFAPVFVATRDAVKGPQQQSMIVQGELGADGNQMAQVIYGPNDPLLAVAVAQTKGKQWVHSQGSLQYSGTGWTGSMMFVSQPLQAVTILASDYLRKWGERLTVGTQFMAQVADIPQPGMPSIHPMMSLAARWREKEWVASGNVGLMDGSMHASYYHFIPPAEGASATLAGCEFVWDPRLTGQQYPVAKIGMQYNFRQAVFKAHISSEGEVAAALDQEIFPPLTFNINGVLDHHTGVFKSGIGLTFNS